MKTREIITITFIGKNQPSAEELKLAEEVEPEFTRNIAAMICGNFGGIIKSTYSDSFSKGSLLTGSFPVNETTSASQYINTPVFNVHGYTRDTVIIKSSQSMTDIGGN